MPEHDNLAARQAALVAALVAGAEVPAGLDADRVRIQAATLLRKRGRSVAGAQPELALALGESFRTAFAAYAAGRPKECCSTHDAVGFARYLLNARHARDPHVRSAARRVTRAQLLSRARRAHR
jgi:hypothetical protein